MLSTNPADAGNRIRHAIKSAGLTQAQTAAAIDVTPQSVNRWIKEGKISRENLMALSRATGSTFTWLSTGEGPQLYRTSESVFKAMQDTGLVHAQIMDDLGIAPRTFIQWIVEAPPEDLPQMTDRIVEVLHTTTELVQRMMKTSLMEGAPAMQADFKGGLTAWHTPVAGALQLDDSGWGQLVKTDVEDVEARTSDPTAYGRVIRGNQLEPAICNNWVLLIEPSVDPRPGEYVLVRLNDDRCSIREYLYKRGDEYSFSDIVGKKERTSIPQEDIRYIRRVGAMVPPAL
jgi:transcriptional regulator with XRE-family HTH domain